MATKGTDTKNRARTSEGLRLLDRIAFKVKEGETVLHLDYSIDSTDLVMRVIMPFCSLGSGHRVFILVGYRPSAS